MRKLYIFTIALALALPAFWPQPSAASAGRNPSASGHGNLTVNDALRTFSFNAVKHQDGIVTGQAELYNRSSDVTFHIAIDCLLISGNTATMSGIITNSNNPAFNGYHVYFTVQDNGEGAGDPDRISLVAYGSSLPDCNTTLDLQMYPIEGGNIQVRP